MGGLYSWAVLFAGITSVGLKTRVHLRNGQDSTIIELEPTDHPLAIEQRVGIDRARVIQLYEQTMSALEASDVSD